MFDVNSVIIFVIVAIIVLAVLGQSVYFLVRALKRAKEKEMDKSVLRKTITSSIIFTIAPAVSILIGVISLSKSLGIPLPWLRLSIIGSLSYESVAADSALKAFNDPSITTGTTITDPQVYITVAWVMTMGILLGLILVPILTKKIQGGMKLIEKKDKHWGEIFTTAMFMGMISAFLGFVFCDVGLLWTDGSTSGLIPVCVMLTSALVMAVIGLMSVKFKIRWLADYALPVSMIVGMALAIPFTAWLG